MGQQLSDPTPPRSEQSSGRKSETLIGWKLALGIRDGAILAPGLNDCAQLCSGSVSLMIL